MPNFMKIERGPDFFLLIWYGMTRLSYCYMGDAGLKSSLVTIIYTVK